ncbi:NAD(P)-dependent oxidoreductase [Gluconobacter kanchanaburiensis]|uniref:3-hydroxyisobutyrate dehydrogenase n=1 Tax=Gluconobacter kanchanaburiensis NBRC 103587 TaxID=1307948 RepID=A0A511B7X9_9PROT|nr:NAD(P)-dependent oxidoreductase [Gluconobacter kanchanaburiensis]MBF0861428.1 NAD(P)-dependent oxidoreductase [Gluconobacter kanchanaburiensis]GBR68276.1 oxidoreductase [Gluconobacter kanchanaburiensis NBRC 103587]GEK95791.1 3-hydroxyisobutyrate dehydrogenase [Gluconobacter kanchanaburiensis NBRC 103587]
MKVGFVGLGSMGHAMAGRLLKGGHEVVVTNRTRAKADDLLAQGAVFAETPAEVARQVEIVFSMLFDDASTEEVVFGEHGIASGLAPGAIHACSSTLSLAQARRLKDGHAERGQVYVSAAVLGRPPAAQAGELFVIAAGQEDALSRLRPLFGCFGQRVFEMGQDPLQANLAKLSLNFMIFSTIEQMAEVFAINEKAGTDPHRIFDLMTGSFYNAPVHRNYGKLMVDHEYDNPGAPVTLGLKDVEMFLKAGGEQGVPLPYASIVRDRFLGAISAGDADRDFVVLLERVRQDGGLK